MSEQVLGIARLRGLPAPPLQHSYVHGAEDGTTSIRFSPIRCQCQTATGLYTPSPSHSPDGRWTLSMSSPGAAGTRFYTIVATSRRSSVHGFSFGSDALIPHAFMFYRTKYLSYPNGEFSPTYISVLHPNPVHSCKFLIVVFASSPSLRRILTIRVHCDAGPTSFS
ncbi:hypothetical protein BJ912DRAFT_1062797 [Pholiota molesta]|nr:hypothetical protein BJ912DRAFT_1062797 [Pholiota molesta]